MMRKREVNKIRLRTSIRVRVRELQNSMLMTALFVLLIVIAGCDDSTEGASSFGDSAGGAGVTAGVDGTGGFAGSTGMTAGVDASGGTAGSEGEVVVEPPTSDQEGPAVEREIFPAEGDTEFVSANENELLSTGTYNSDRGVSARGALDTAEADSDSQTGAAPSNGVPVVEQEAIPDPTREIVEADIFKLEGDLLYILNRYRGLLILDVSDPDNLQVRGRLPFQSVPVEMYIRDGRAYVVSSDYFVYWQFDPEADSHGFHGSQVMILDVSDPDEPASLGTLPVDGEITDTRMVGDVLYSVSKRRPDYWRYNTVDWEDRTWIVSLNISDPANIREIDRVTFRGSSTLIHVAHHAIFVAAWDPNFYLTDPDHEQETLVTYVDISDAEGDLRTRGQVYIPGNIQDKFKMNWHDGVFRVFSRSWRGDDAIQIHTVRTDTPDELEITSTLSLDQIDRSGLQATRFAGDAAYAVTSTYHNRTRFNHLHTLNLSDAEAPRHVTSLRHDMSISHLEIHGDRLLAMGQRYANRESRSVVALFDISDLENPELLSWTPLGEGYSNSEANADYKAFKSYRELGLVLVPLNYWTNNNNRQYNRRFEGVSLISWVDDTLHERGQVENGGGVRRAFPVGDRIVAVGELTIATIDHTDLDSPAVTDRLYLVKRVHDIFEFDGLMAQLVTDMYDSSVRVEIYEFGQEDYIPPIASLELPFNYAPYLLRDGTTLHAIGWDNTQGGQVIRNIDLSNPREPRLRGVLHLSDEFERIHNNGYSYYVRYWSPYAGMPLRKQLLPVTFRRIVENESGRRDFDSRLQLIDLRDIDSPRLCDDSIPMNDYPFVNKITHGNILYSSHVEQATSDSGESLQYHVRSYVDRVDATDPDAIVALPSINIPGYLIDVSEDGGLLYTVDFQWDNYGRRRNSLNVLKVHEDRAEIVSVIPVTDQIHRAALRRNHLLNGDSEVDNRTIWLTAHKYPWWGVHNDTVSSRQPYTVLRRFDFNAEGEVASHTSVMIKGYHFNLLDIEDERGYFASTGPHGLLTLDLSDSSAPLVESTARTIGYLSRIVVNEGTVYAPMGVYGVHHY